MVWIVEREGRSTFCWKGVEQARRVEWTVNMILEDMVNVLDDALPDWVESAIKEAGLHFGLQDALEFEQVERLVG
jgi:hypothetical protein